MLSPKLVLDCEFEPAGCPVSRRTPCRTRHDLRTKFNTAVDNGVDTVESFKHALIVGDHNDGGVLFTPELPEQVHDRPAVFRIERSRRLVGEDDARSVDDGAGDRQSLLLPPG